MSEPLIPKTLIIGAESSAAAIRLLYEQAKKNNPRISIGSIAKKLAYKSRSNFSDILGGRRILAPNKIPVLKMVFSLTVEEVACLKLLIGRDRARTAAEIRLLTKKLRRAEAFLKNQSVDVKSKTSYSTIRVSVAFGVFGGECTRAQLVKFFGKERASYVDTALKELLEARLIERKSNGRFARTNFWNAFRDPTLWQQNMNDGIAAYDKWSSHKEWAYFPGIMICVKEKDYLKTVSKFRTKIIDELMKIVSPDGDLIANFGMHLYPNVSASKRLPNAAKN